MKKMMGIVLGLSLAVGAFTFAFGQDGKDTTKQTGKKTGKNKKKDTTK